MNRPGEWTALIRMLAHPISWVLLAWSCVVQPVPAQPRIDQVTPVALQRGEKFTLTLQGPQLRDAHDFLAYRPGLQIERVEPIDDGTVKVHGTVEATTPPGMFAFRLACRSAISNLRAITITALPVVIETEPNAVEGGQALTLPVTICGLLTPEDEDCFAIHLAADEWLHLEVQGLRLGYEFYDPYLEILGPDRQVLHRADDTVLSRQDPITHWQAPAEGTYTVRLRERTFGGSGQCHYALHIGRFPRPLLAAPGGGQAGKEAELRLHTGVEAIDARESPVRVALPGEPTRLWEWYPQTAEGISPTPLSLHVSEFPDSVEVEPNDSRQQATPVTLPTVVHGVLDKGLDRDFFRFVAKPGEAWVMTSLARKVARADLDVVLRVYKVGGGQVAANDDADGADAQIVFTAPEEGEYLLEVSDLLRRGHLLGHYRVEIGPPRPRFFFDLPHRIYNTPITLPIPQGNRMALLVVAARQGLSGAVDVRCTELPGGVSFVSGTVAEDRDRIPVVFTADETAPRSGSMVDLVGTCVTPQGNVTGRLEQRTMLAIGLNNRDMWGHTADRLATAVVAPAPFRVTLRPLTLPIVRLGQKPVRVVLERADQFNEPVRVQLLYNPPGLSSPWIVEIPAGQSEGVIPMTADGGAALGQWPIVALAQANVEGIPVEVSTEIAQLTVEDVLFDVAFQKASVPQGKTGVLRAKITARRPVVGSVQCTLLGLPPGVTSEPIAWRPEQPDMEFPLRAEATARPGHFQSTVCQLVVSPPTDGAAAGTENATAGGQGDPATERIEQTVGTAQVRVDPPRDTQPAPPGI